MINLLNLLLGRKNVIRVLSKFSKLEKDLEDALSYHSSKADYHAAQASVQQELSVRSTKALQAVKTLLGN